MYTSVKTNIRYKESEQNRLRQGFVQYRMRQQNQNVNLRTHHVIKYFPLMDACRLTRPEISKRLTIKKKPLS